MLRTTNDIIREDFALFVRKAFAFNHGGEPLGKEPYIDYLCHELNMVAEGETKRLLINLPPRHLKTFLASICLPAWVLAHEPSRRIMVITYNDELAEQITYKIREILQSRWFREIFKTEIAPDRSRAGDFATTKGGGVFATSVGGALAGRGGDYIIFDDPLDIKDANNSSQIARVCTLFDTAIVSRLNNPKKGRILIIAHRLSANDFSDHVLQQGGWRHVVLPLVAVRRRSYELDYGHWHRRKAELLRPGLFSVKKLERLRKTSINPDFEFFYQQGVGGGQSVAIKAGHFQSFSPNLSPQAPVILSVDPGQRSGSQNSFSVIQAWAYAGNDHYLLQQWREQCTYDALRKAYWAFVRAFRPVCALIEATAMGTALISDARRGASVVEVTPDSRSKAARLAEHVPIIRRKRIWLPEGAPWATNFIQELVSFPHAPFDDQVDATTQYLDWATTHPVPALPPVRGLCAGVTSNGLRLAAGGGSVMASRPGVVVRRSLR